MPEKNETNKVRLIGEVVSEFTFNHEVFGEKFYFVSLSVTRLSGQVDVVPVSISERLMDISKDYRGTTMEEELLKMSVNARCVGCKEPTKFVAGFYDGPRGEHGCFYDCENEACAVNQILRCAESKEAQKMQIQEDNGRLGMYAGEIAALRKDVGLTIMQMSQMAGCSPAEYSAYEHERKKFDPEVYRKCKGYLHERRVKNGTINE